MIPQQVWWKKVINRHIVKGLFVVSAGGNDGILRTFWSLDGVSWTPWEALTERSAPGQAVAYGAGVWAAAADDLWVSKNNGKSFSSVGSAAQSDTIAQMGYSKLSKARRGRFYANRQLFEGSGDDVLLSSVDGFNWNEVVNVGLNKINGVSIANNTLFTFPSVRRVEDDGYQYDEPSILRSVDGVSFQDLGNPFGDFNFVDINGSHKASADIWGIAYGNGIYVCIASVTADGIASRSQLAAATSTNGTSWSGARLLNIAQGNSHTNCQICFTDGLFVTGGSWYALNPPPIDGPGFDFGSPISTVATLGRVASSPDGVSWTYYQPISGVSVDFSMPAAGNKRFILPFSVELTNTTNVGMLVGLNQEGVLSFQNVSGEIASANQSALNLWQGGQFLNAPQPKT